MLGFSVPGLPAYNHRALTYQQSFQRSSERYANKKWPSGVRELRGINNIWRSISPPVKACRYEIKASLGTLRSFCQVLLENQKKKLLAHISKARWHFCGVSTCVNVSLWICLNRNIMYLQSLSKLSSSS